MPELPEVETIVRELSAEIVGDRIEAATVRWAKAVAPLTPDAFALAAAQRRIHSVSRRGKHILIELDELWMLIHLRMTGRMLVAPRIDDELAASKHVQVWWALTSGRALLFWDVRKFGRVLLCEDPLEVVGDLGPEPLGDQFTPAALKHILTAHHRQIKPLLLDQRVLAGLGNIYVDESLWRAGIHPLRRSHTLNEAEATRLYASIRAELRQAIDHRGTTLRDYRNPANEAGGHGPHLAAYGRTDAPCPRCGTPIVRSVVGSRGTHHCPICQPHKGAEDDAN